MNPMEPSLYSQAATANAAAATAAASAAANTRGRSIGVILIDSGRLSADNAERILRLQKEQGKRFGDAAIELGLLTEDDIRFALSSQFDYPYLPVGDSSLSHELVAAYKPFSPCLLYTSQPPRSLSAGNFQHPRQRHARRCRRRHGRW